MTNQPKRYKKFLATTATASLVASAIVPVATAASTTFQDVKSDNSHVEAINALVEAGIIKGYEDGTFKPNAKLTRGQVVKMLGKWVESQGFEIPADYNIIQRFDDVAVDATDQELVKYAALVKDTGVFVGSEGNLNAADHITRENMALTLDRAYKAIFGKSLVELAADTENTTVADLATAKEEVRQVIQALRNLGISSVDNFQPKETVTRAQFASLLNRTINASAKPATEVKVGIKSLEATAVNQLTVTFDGAITTTDTAKFTVNRGNTAIAVSKVEWNEEKTEAILTVDHKFSDGTYVLTVSGVGENDLTASVTTAREEVASINFLSNKLVFTGKTKGDYNQAVIAFEAINQYGEDITKNISTNRYVDERVRGIDINKDDITIENGKFIVWVEKDEDDDQTGSVEFTYKNGDYEIDVYQDVQLSDISEPGSVELLSIYNSSNKELTTKNLKDAATDLEEFYLLFKVKDQYGVEIDAEFAEKVKTTSTTGDTTILDEVQKGLRVSVSNRDIFDLKDEEEIKVLNVDGEYYFALQLDIRDVEDLVGGENVVEFRAKATGEITSKTYKVEHSSEVYKVELSYPDEVIAGGETVKLPVTATDQNGEVITDVKALNDDLKDGSITIDWDKGLTKLEDDKASKVFSFIKEKDKVYLKFETADNLKDKAEDYDIDIEVDKSDVESTLTVYVEPNAYPARIALKDIKHNYVFLGDERSDTIIFEDQYGREFNNKSVGTSDKPGGVNGYKFYEVTATSSNKDVMSVTNSSNKVEIKSLKKGSSTIKLRLTARNIKGELIEDTLDVTYRTIEIEDFDSFKVKSDGVLFGGDKFVKVDEAGISVVGLIGKLEVGIPTDEYNIVTDSKYLSTDNKEVTADTASIKADGILDKETDKYEADILVTINDTGETIRHTLTLTREGAKANSFKINDSSGLAKKTLESLNIKYSEVSQDLKLTADEIFKEIEGKFDLNDQYNNKFLSYSTATGKVEFFDGSTDKIRPIISEINSDKDKDVVSSNGTENMTITLGENGLTEGDTFDLTLTIGGKSQTIKVYIK